MCDYTFNAEYFNSTVLSYKRITLFYFLNYSWPESQSASLPYSGVRQPWWQYWQNNNLPRGCEGLKGAATSRSLGNRGYVICRISLEMIRKQRSVFQTFLLHHQFKWIDTTLKWGYISSPKRRTLIIKSTNSKASCHLCVNKPTQDFVFSEVPPSSPGTILCDLRQYEHG